MQNQKARALCASLGLLLEASLLTACAVNDSTTGTGTTAAAVETEAISEPSETEERIDIETEIQPVTEATVYLPAPGLDTRDHETVLVYFRDLFGDDYTFARILSEQDILEQAGLTEPADETSVSSYDTVASGETISTDTKESVMETETTIETDSVNDTEAITETDSVNDTEAITETDSADDTETITETDSVDDTEATTKTDSVDDTETTTKTDSLNNTEAATETDAVSISELTELLTRGDLSGITELIVKTGTSAQIQQLPETDSPDETAVIDETDSANETDSIDETDSANETDSIDETDSVDETDSIDETDSADETDSIDGTDSADETDSIDGTDSADETDSIPASSETETAKTPAIVVPTIPVDVNPGPLRDLQHMYRVDSIRMPKFKNSIHLLENRIQHLVEEYEGLWSVSVLNLETGELIAINECSMKSASIMKLYVMAAVYDAFDKGELERSSELVSRLSSMISASSNEDANKLILALGNGSFRSGIARVNEYIVSHGYSDDTRLYNGFNNTDYVIHPGHFNSVSATDVAHLLEKIYHRTFGSWKDCNEIENFMLNQQTRYKIPKGISNINGDVKIGNKTGEMDTVENDAAVVYSDACDYIICILSDQWTNKDAAQRNIQQLSAEVYRYFNDDNWLSSIAHIPPSVMKGILK